MAKSNTKVDDIMVDAQSVSADDPDMLEKLNLIAQKIAEAQGKKTSSSSQNNNFNNVDPMDELGCEGCQ
jgi:DNA-binding protein YbaB